MITIKTVTGWTVTWPGTLAELTQTEAMGQVFLTNGDQMINARHIVGIESESEL